jgi:putative lipoic acid-binding regulatory protein
MTEDKKLLTFPCDFMLKVMGNHHPQFQEAMQICLQGLHVSFDPEIKVRDSHTGRYVGLTILLKNIGSQDTLDEIYRTLSSHPWVKVVL